jgi:glycosyltransferase involved in cell wall biosynthesis
VGVKLVEPKTIQRSEGKAQRVIDKRKNLKVVGYKKNRGKGNAFKFGVKHATRKVIVILDADMATPPEEIPKVICPILSGDVDFVNGTRFIYPMEKKRSSNSRMSRNPTCPGR